MDIPQEKQKKRPTRRDPADRLPPYSEEAERGVLGCILTSPLDAMPACQEAGVQADWFDDVRHQTIYHNLERLFLSLEEDQTVDIIVLHQRLQDTGSLEDVGGLAYLNTIADSVPSAANLSYYVDIVREKWMLRKTIQAATSMVADIYDHEGALDSLLVRVQKDIADLVEESVPRAESKARAYLPGVIRKLEEYHRGHAQMEGLATGLVYVDKMLCGIGGDNGNMFVISARPGVGKTSVALQIALHVALDHLWFDPERDAAGDVVMDGEKPKGKGGKGLPVCIFSLEMASTALVKRMLFQRAEADMQRWRNGYATKDDFPPLIKASTELERAPIYIDDTPRCNIEGLVAKARRMHRQHGIRMFVVDYFQLLHSRRDYKNDRVQELSYCSGMLFALGKLLNTPILVLAQMNRDYEKDPNRTPRLSDLKDCGAIEQDADVVGFLYEPKFLKGAEEKFEEQIRKVYPNKKGTDVDWSRAPIRVNWLFAKNRYGMTGKAELLFHRNCTLFCDYNEWQKKHQFKDLASGERPEPVPENEDLL